MKRTYIDANVLIAAFQGEESVAQRALRVLDDPDRKLVVSDYLRLEVLPKPTFHRRREEVEFMQSVLDKAENVSTSSDLTGKSLEFATKYDMTPIDALHVGASAVAAVDELVTMEKPTKPMCRILEINVKSLHSSTAESR
jgi:predicted nucleic acid-binding protein